MTQALGLGQISLTAPQCSLNLPRSGDVRDGPDKLDGTLFIPSGVSHGADILHGAIRHQQSVLMVEILPFTRGLVEGRLHGSAIFRMRPLKTQLHSRSRRSVELEDAEGFLRPENFAVRDVPAKAPGLAYPLGFAEI